jgi:sentrin-specific protease 7
MGFNSTENIYFGRHLKNQIQEEEKPRFHFFNSFFFRKLADLDKNPSSASDGKAAFLRVRKWTRKVNLFEKDYIFIPVNFKYDSITVFLLLLSLFVFKF